MQIDWDYYMRLAQQGTPGLDPSAGSIIHFYHFRRWRESGIAYELRDCKYNEVNRTLLSTAYGTRKEYTDRFASLSTPSHCPCSCKSLPLQCIHAMPPHPEPCSALYMAPARAQEHTCHHCLAKVSISWQCMAIQHFLICWSFLNLFLLI